MTQQYTSLQDFVDAKSDLVDYLYNDTKSPHGRDSVKTPVPPEFTNWRSEQKSWRESAVLFDQSHHMPELFVKGPNALRLLTRIGVNSLANLQPGVAKQFVGCNEQGQMIGDCILHALGDDTYQLISSMPLLNWVRFHGETGGYDVSLVLDPPTPNNPNARTNFRYEVDGPNAWAIFDEVVEGGAPEIPFFRTTSVRIAGVDVLALRHSMSGHKGVELSGPNAHGQKVHAALLDAGQKHGLMQGGTLAYYSSTFESGWLGFPIPAIYTGEATRAYREWLPGDGWEARFQLAGSFRPDSIEDYYVSPFALGYGKIIKFDHDFIGREALDGVDRSRERRKVTLHWNADDVSRVFASLMEPDLPFKYIQLPLAHYGFQQRDVVRTIGGDLVGLSAMCGYTGNDNAMLSLAMIDPEHAEFGTELVLTWGEPNGGSRKPHVERHRQAEIRVTVAPAPYAKPVREWKGG